MTEVQNLPTPSAVVAVEQQKLVAASGKAGWSGRFGRQILTKLNIPLSYDLTVEL